MTTIAQTENKVHPVKSNGNLAVVMGPEQIAAFSEKNDRVLQLANLLQTSLNVDEILAQFNSEIRGIFKHDHLSYVNEKHEINIVIGKVARHSCTYELTINQEQLGILSLTRNTKFSTNEIEQLEYLICAIHYPLRNSLMYMNAVKAAHKDPLTGIGNRGAMSTSLRREIEKAFRHSRALGIIMMDVDHFKKVNDVYGHTVGDYVLQSLVECAENSVRISDMMFRYGGEEFVIVLPETDKSGVLRLAKRIRRRVEKLDVTIQDIQINISVSLGITNLVENDDEKTLLSRADEALYKAKRDGRNCIRIAP